MNFVEKCSQIRLILSDVDGVMTDGRIIIDNQGIETKHFHSRDGQGIRMWQLAGGQFGIVTGRSSQIVKLRAEDLDIEIVRQGIHDKLSIVRLICEEFQLEADEVCFVGDDLPDLAPIQHVGLGIAVADAAGDVRQAADYTTSEKGGYGAIREVVELLLKNSNRWESALKKYQC